MRSLCYLYNKYSLSCRATKRSRFCIDRQNVLACVSIQYCGRFRVDTTNELKLCSLLCRYQKKPAFDSIQEMSRNYTRFCIDTKNWIKTVLVFLVSIQQRIDFCIDTKASTVLIHFFASIQKRSLFCTVTTQIDVGPTKTHLSPKPMIVQYSAREIPA